MGQCIIHVGLDVHKDTIALVETGLRGEGHNSKYLYQTQRADLMMFSDANI
jgi:hypothetical protein